MKEMGCVGQGGKQEGEERNEATEESPKVAGEGVEPSGASQPWLRSSSISASTSSSSGLSGTSISGISLIRSSTERLPSIYISVCGPQSINRRTYYIGGCFLGP